MELPANISRTLKSMKINLHGKQLNNEKLYNAFTPQW